MINTSFNPFLQRTMNKNLMVLVCLFVLPLFIGCGGRNRLPGLVPAEGIVTLNGTPVEGTTISFAPGSPAIQSASATSTKDGKFVVSTRDYGDGISPGEYLVVVTKTTGVGRSLSPDDKRGRDNRQSINHLPPKYGSKDTSGLTVTIPAKGDKNIELKLEGEVNLTPQRLGGPRR
jgi:hypothetical protein